MKVALKCKKAAFFVTREGIAPCVRPGRSGLPSIDSGSFVCVDYTLSSDTTKRTL